MAQGKESNYLYNGLKNLDPLAKPELDLSQSDADIERTRGLADAYANERHSFQDRTDSMAPQQQGAIDILGGAARGTAPSAAEIMLKKESAANSARQFGNAAALRGNSPGSALRAATEGATQLQADTANNAAALRANEMAAGRSAYANAIGNARGQNISQQQTDDAWRKALIDANISASGQAVSGSNAQVNAQTAAMQAEQQRKGAVFSAIGSAFGVSDERAKKDIKPRSLADALGESVHGVTFEYKPGVADGGEHYGLLAQELQKVMPGVVQEGADGLKRVDTAQLSMGNTATIAELAKRLRAVEGRKAA